MRSVRMRPRLVRDDASQTSAASDGSSNTYVSTSVSPRDSRSRSRSQLVFLVMPEHSEEQGQQRQHSHEAPEAPLLAVPHCMLEGGGGNGREIEMRSRSRGEEQSAAILEVIRGNHTSRAVASTIGTSMRRRASNAVPARIERLASALTNSVRSYCKSGRARAIRGHQRQSEAIRVGKGSCNQRPSEAITPRGRWRRRSAPVCEGVHRTPCRRASNGSRAR